MLEGHEDNTNYNELFFSYLLTGRIGNGKLSGVCCYFFFTLFFFFYQALIGWFLGFLLVH